MIDLSHIPTKSPPFEVAISFCYHHPMSYYGNRKRLDKDSFADIMRQKPTPAESKLHNALIDAFLPYQTQIVHQYVVGPFIADFKVKHFLIEVDGSSHDGKESYDARRTTYMENKGYSVLRVLNTDVLKDAHSVAVHIVRETGPHHPRKDSPIQVTHCPPSRSFWKPEKKKRFNPAMVGITGRKY